MTPERALWLLQHYVLCAGLPFAFSTGMGYQHAEGITSREDFFIKTVWVQMSDESSYFNAIEKIARGL